MIDIQTIKYEAPTKLEVEYGEGVAEALSQAIREEIDFQLQCTILLTMGWTKIKLNLDYEPAKSLENEIKEWCKKTLKGNFHIYSNSGIFEDEKDATMFILRWS
jgi:hypothetical protein